MRETYEFMLDGIRWTVDPPRQESYAMDASNNSLLIVSARNGSNNLLFMGDARTERIREFLSTEHTEYTFLKVPHHGRGEPLMEAPLQSALPSYAVVTSSEDGPESEETMGQLGRTGVEGYLTRLGAVVVRCDGGELQIGYDT